MVTEHASDFLTRLRQSWRRAVSRRRTIGELAAYPPGELTRIASDVGLSGKDLWHLCCGHMGPSALLPQRLQLLGIDPEFVRHAAPTTFRDLARVCASCKASRRCARFGLRRRPSRAGRLLLEQPDHRRPDGARGWTHGTIMKEKGGQHALVDDTSCRTTSDAHA